MLLLGLIGEKNPGTFGLYYSFSWLKYTRNISEGAFQCFAPKFCPKDSENGH